jgi:hypothetical protein
MVQCPACDHPLLSCIRKHQQYLFCSHCRGEMPHFTGVPPAVAAVDLSDRLESVPVLARSLEATPVTFSPQSALIPAV